MVFKPALNITEQIADHLAERIITDDLSDGTRIQELKIAGELNVSRGSVREALLLLERRYLIEIVPRKGAVVTSLSSADAHELIEMLNTVELRWFRQLGQLPELSMLIAELEGIVADMTQGAKSGDLDRVVQARGEFYAAVLQPASRYVQGVFACLLPGSQRLMRRMVLHTDVELYDIARYYKALANSLKATDEERLTELLNAFRNRLGRLCARTSAADVARTVNV